MRRTPRLASILAATALAAVLTAPATAGAAPTWKCRASSAYAQLTGLERIEPLVANADGVCADDQASLTGDVSAGPLTQSNPYARTTIDPDAEPAATQRVTAESRADATTIQSPDGNFVLRAEAIQAQASARCLGGQPVLFGTSSVARATVGGQPVSLDGPLEQAGTGLNGSPLGGLIQVRFNEQETTGNSLVRRAVHVRITDATGATILDQVAGEAIVGYDAGVCQTGDGISPVPACPAGSEFDATSGYCVRIVTVRQDGDGTGGSGGSGSGADGRGPCPEGFYPTSNGNCIRAVPVDDAGNPLGGSVVPLDEVPGAAKSPCRSRRFGKKLVAIRGTSRRDNVTGTNRSDRIFVFGGNDFVSGGRGNDCLEGGGGVNRLDGSTGSDSIYGRNSKDAMVGGSGADRIWGRGGNDRITGGLGNDRVSGGSGRDKIVGGPGHDLLYGGPGNDSFDVGTGRNRVKAGRGNDKVNAANTGKGSRIDCGPGRDTVRVNRLKGNRLKSCERVFVLKRKR
jgi:hypothetical protein